MSNDRVSVIIPARNEAHLQKTVDDLLAKAHGDIEIIPVLDGLMANGEFQPVKNDPRVKPIRKTVAEGMRPAINDAARAATGKYLMKCDGHVILGDGYDAILKADCDYDWLVVPTRHSIEASSWTMLPRHFNYHILTYPFICATMYGEGFHGVTFSLNSKDKPNNALINAQRADTPIDDILSAQGSLWFQHREYFLSFPPLDHARMYFYQESQECMLRILAAGGRCVVNKKTHYGHWHKGKESQGADGRQGRGFFLDVRKKRLAEAIMCDWCVHGWPKEWPHATRSFESIIEQHWWLISQMTDPRYAWPADWQNWNKYEQTFRSRTPDQIPAHV